MSRHRGDQTMAERIIVGALLTGSALLFLLLLLAWWAPRAEATRVIPGHPLPDVCSNIRGTQTILDTTTGHRFRVVAVTPRGNVCRPLHRGGAR